MLEDIRIRDFSVDTQTGYIRAVKRFADYLGRSPDTATAEDLRLFQLHMIKELLRKRCSPSAKIQNT